MTHDAALADPSARIAGNAAALALSRVVTSGLLLAWQIVLARGLGPERYGVYGTIGAMMAVGATIPDLGAGVIFIRDVARRPLERGRYLGAALALQGGLAALGYVVLQAVAASLGYNTTLRTLVAFVGVNLFIDALGTTAHNQFVAAERMSWAALVAVGHVCLLVLLGGLALAAGGGLWAIDVAALAAGTCRTVAFWVAAGRQGWWPQFPVDRQIARRLFTAGLPLGVAAFLSLGFLHADKLATTAIIGAAATGQLVAAFVIVFGTVELIGTTALVAVFPMMSRRGAQARLSGFDPIVLHLLSFYALAGLPVTALLVVSGPTIASLLFGNAFGRVAGLWSVMGWFIIVHMVEGALAQALTVRERQVRVLMARAGGLVVNLGVTLALLPRIGLVGAAVGMLVGEVAIVGVMWRLLAPPAVWWRQLGDQVARIGVAGAVLFGVLIALGPYVPLQVAAAIGIAAYGIVAVVTGAVTAEQRERLGQWVRTRRAMAGRPRP